MMEHHPLNARKRMIEIGTCQVYGETFYVPKVLLDELARLRAMERQFQDEERVRLLREWEAQHGPLPAPPSEPYWVPVDRDGLPVDQ